jgi:hypothetical protein
MTNREAYTPGAASGAEVGVAGESHECFDPFVLVARDETGLLRADYRGRDANVVSHDWNAG